MQISGELWGIVENCEELLRIVLNCLEFHSHVVERHGMQGV